MSTGFLTEQDAEFLDGTDASGFEIATDDIDCQDLESGGLVELEGWYHFEVTDVKPQLDIVKEDGSDNTPNILFALTVLQTVKGQSPANSRLFHRVYVGSKGGGPPAEGSVKSMIVFGCGLGLLRQVEKNGRKVAVDVQTGQPKLSVAMWLRGKGAQCVGKVEKEEDKSGQYKPRLVLPFGRVFRPDDERVAHVPKNPDALKLIGISPAAATNQPAAAKGQTNQSSQPADAQQASKATAEDSSGWGINDL